MRRTKMAKLEEVAKAIEKAAGPMLELVFVDEKTVPNEDGKNELLIVITARWR